MQTHDYSQWIGRSETAPADVVTPRLIAGVAATFGDTLAAGNEVPPGLHWCLSPPAVTPDDLGPDGHPAKGGFLPPISLPRRMWAGGRISFLAPLLQGDVVEKMSTIKAIDWKRGKSGDLCFVTVAHDYTTSRGIAISEDQNIVYRAAPKGPAHPQPPKVCDKAFDRVLDVPIDPVRLFRYSAITFNGHRIHYDLPYAQTVEHYPGLVIHGPLQATLLLNFATSHRGHLPRSFAYRGVSPATGVQTLRLGLNETSDHTAELSAVSEEGAETMVAEACW